MKLAINVGVVQTLLQNKMDRPVHPFIHLFLLILFQGHRGAGAFPSCLKAKGRLHRLVDIPVQSKFSQR